MIRLRVYEFLRSAHLERIEWLEDSRVLFRRRSYDLVSEQALLENSKVRQASLLRVFCEVSRTKADILELNEPFMLASWKTSIVALLGARSRRYLGREKIDVVIYAIENLDPRVIFGHRIRFIPTRLISVVVKVVVGFMLGNTDRMVFGTHGARDNYLNVAGRALSSVETKTIAAIPSECPCLLANRNLKQVIFVGSFEYRKGIIELMASWDYLNKLDPDLNLVLIGKGEMLPLIMEWAQSSHNVSVIVDPPRSLIHKMYLQSRVVFLPSQRTAEWREQIGLPILEGLAHGCEILASSETGLASWLTEYGHYVLSPKDSPRLYAQALQKICNTQDRSSSIRKSLPALDSRIAADFWLAESVSR